MAKYYQFEWTDPETHERRWSTRYGTEDVARRNLHAFVSDSFDVETDRVNQVDLVVVDDGRKETIEQFVDLKNSGTGLSVPHVRSCSNKRCLDANAVQARHCRRCGNALAIEAGAGEPLFIECKRCGDPSDYGGNYCPYCGHKFTDEELYFQDPLDPVYDL